ncbi:hypothetical protein [Saccharopolyspora sp. NPDC050642]|uniref:hypothetical protein n=1 Tax=Saccharopolyspora sp. NPDC050642 TaxID=3157099 RepID=UPI0033D9E037
MTAAIFGLVGVIIGGLLTGLVDFMLERRRERNDARAASKLLRSQLNDARTAVVVALEGREWPLGWNDKAWAQSWSVYWSALAGRMADDAFLKLAEAYNYMELLQRGLADGGRALSGNDEEFLNDVRKSIDAAEPLLAR